MARPSECGRAATAQRRHCGRAPRRGGGSTTRGPVKGREARMRRLVAFVAVALLALTACQPTASPLADWPQFHAGPCLQGHNTQEVTLSATTVPHIGVMWVGLIGGPANSSPAVSSGVVYVASNDGKIFALGLNPAITPAPSASPRPAPTP